MTPLQRRIVSNIKWFDPVNLLQLLAFIGYGPDDILFRSHFSRCSPARLLESIEFIESPGGKAVVTLNLGLLTGQSVLPNYFFEMMEDGVIDERRFAEFFGYFDDRILRRFLLAVYPELDSAIHPDWEARKQISLQTLKLNTPASLHWLMQLIFPELQVRVEKTQLERSVEIGAPVLGKTALGYQTVLGKIKKMPDSACKITLIADEEHFIKGCPWPLEIEGRLYDRLFPVLREQELDLEIWLMIRNQGTVLDLKKDSYLGYENIAGGEERLRRIRIFSGPVAAEN